MGPSTSKLVPGHEENKALWCLLSATDIFQDLTPEEVEEIHSTITVKEVEKGRIIYMPEDSGEVLFILRQGRVQLYRLSADGRKLVLSIVGPGAIFGEMSLVGQGMHQGRQPRCLSVHQQQAKREQGRARQQQAFSPALRVG